MSQCYVTNSELYLQCFVSDYVYLYTEQCYYVKIK